VTRTVFVGLAAISLGASSSALYGASRRVAARPAGPARKAMVATRPVAAAPPQEVLAEGLCRYRVSQGEEPSDEVRFLFRSAELTLPQRGGTTPVVVFRDYLPDVPEGAPEIERMSYGQEIARFDLVPEAAGGKDGGPTRWSRPRPAPGLPLGREAELLGLPWIALPPPRAGLTWERSEVCDFPHLKERFRYRIIDLTTVGGRRAWRVERRLAGDPATARTVPELKTPAHVEQWLETFWVDAGSGDLLRAERRVGLVSNGSPAEVPPTRLTLEVNWVRKGTRPLAAADYQSRKQLFARLDALEQKVKEASARPTLDGAADLRLLREKLEDLRDEFTQRRYEPAFEKIGAAIERGLSKFKDQANGA
jgi:hypothetical protein